MKLIQKLIRISPYILILVCSVRSMIEPDIWWQIRTGQWICEHLSVPTKDFLSYTYFDEKWVNIKWISEIILYVVSKYTSVAFLPLFCGFIFAGVFFILYRWTRKIIVLSYDNALVISSILFTLIISCRINARPEVFSYLFTALFLYIWSIEQKKWHWLIILLQIIWTNTHEGFGTGLILILIKYSIDVIQTKKADIQSFGIVILSVAGMSINPIGTDIYHYMYNIFTQLSDNSFTNEMSSIGSEDYWSIFTRLNILVFVLGIYFIVKSKLYSIHHKHFYLSIIYFVLFYLSLKSSRNVVFFQIIAFPFLLGFFNQFFNESFKSKYWIGVALSILFYCSMSSNWFYTKFNPHNSYGLSISPEKTPIGAIEYLKSKKYNGENVFSDFFSSNYALWAMKPTFRSYLDLRDLDIFPANFYKNTLVLLQQPDRPISATKTLWQLADSIDQFRYILLLNNQDFTPLHRYLLRQTNFQLSYIDPLAAVYIRDTISNHPANIETCFKEYTFDNQDHITSIINKVFNPFYVPLKDREYPYVSYKKYLMDNY